MGDYPECAFTSASSFILLAWDMAAELHYPYSLCLLHFLPRKCCWFSLLQSSQHSGLWNVVHEESYWNHYTYMQDPSGRKVNPFDHGWKKHIVEFLRGKKVPEVDMYSISELKPAAWKHPKDKRTG